VQKETGILWLNMAIRECVHDSIGSGIENGSIRERRMAGNLFGEVNRNQSGSSKVSRAPLKLEEWDVNSN
jgi:hypothetical protein